MWCAGNGLEQVRRADMPHDLLLHTTARQRQIEDMPLDLAHHMHFARFAVEFQGQYFVAVNQLHRCDLGAYAGHALGLLGAQVEGETQAVLGDHHRHFTGFFVGLVGRVNQLHAMAMVEVAGLLVVDVGQERQVRLRVHRRRCGFGLATTTGVGLDTRNRQRFD